MFLSVLYTDEIKNGFPDPRSFRAARQVRSLSFCRGSRVEGPMSRVEGIFYKRLCYSEKDN